MGGVPTVGENNFTLAREAEKDLPEMNSSEEKTYRLEFSERLLVAAGCIQPTPYVSMLAEYIAVEARPDGDVHITVVDPNTREPMTHQPFGQPVTVHDLLLELSRRHPGMAPKIWRN